MQQLIDAMPDVPAFVQNGRLDAVATNRLGAALFSEMFADPPAPTNLARFTFLDPAPELLPRLGRQRPPIVALLRAEAGRAPDDRTSPTSSVSSPPAATSSAPGGPPTTSASTTPAPNASTTPSSATSTSPSRNYRSRPTLA